MALADDLAITMRAMSIRVAPIPGRGAVGVEVPNPTARMVTLRELLESAGVAGPLGAADRAGPRPRGQAGGHRPGQDAASADCRRHRLGQVGGDQHDHHGAGLPLHVDRSPHADDRPQDGRALDVQRSAAPAAPGRHQQPRRRAGAQVGGARDESPLRAAARQRRPQPRGLQPQGRRRKAAQEPAPPQADARHHQRGRAEPERAGRLEGRGIRKGVCRTS